MNSFGLPETGEIGGGSIPPRRFEGKPSAPLQGTKSAANSIARVKYTQDAMIDLIIAEPMISQNTIALHFGYTPAWVSRVFNSDAFQARLAERKGDLVDPTLLLSLDERLKALATRSLDIVMDKLEATKSTELAVKAAEMSIKALGYGARQNNLNVQNNFVVAMPQKAADAGDWAAKHAGLSAGQGPRHLTAAPQGEVSEAILINSPDLAAMVNGG